VCDLETSWMRRPWPHGGLSRQKKKFITNGQQVLITIRCAAKNSQLDWAPWR